MLGPLLMMGACGAPGPKYTDDFNRSNQLLGNYPYWNTETSDWVVVSNQLGFSGDADGGIAVWTYPLPSVNHYVELDIEAGQTGNNHIGLCVRGNSAETASFDNDYYMGRYYPTTGQWEIYKITGASFSLKASDNTNTPTTPYRMRFEAEASGSDVVCRLYEVIAGTPTLRLSWTDTSPGVLDDSDRLYVALRAISTTSLRGDDFETGEIS